MKARLALLALAAVAASSTEAVAQNQYQQQIAQQFTNWAPRFAQQGFSMQGTAFTGTLNDDADESILINLNSGQQTAGCHAFAGTGKGRHSARSHGESMRIAGRHVSR